MVRVACWAVVAALAWLAAPAVSQAASFDCAKAGTPTEKAICKNPAVSKLDDQVAAAFKTAQGLWPAGNWSAFIRSEQRWWLKDRDRICKADVACLKQDYERRLSYLTHPSLKWEGRYVAGRCPHDGVYLDVAQNYPDAGVGVDLYLCPNSAGNMLLQAAGRGRCVGQAELRGRRLPARAGLHPGHGDPVGAQDRALRHGDRRAGLPPRSSQVALSERS
jgi:uncharacterized protein YecT (DUF1311 family)